MKMGENSQLKVPEEIILEKIYLIRNTKVMLAIDLAAHRDILIQLQQMQHNLAVHDDKILLIFEYIRQLDEARQQETDFKERNHIGYKR